MMHISTPISKETLKSLKSGDRVLLSGTIYTARDQAHIRLVEMIEKEEPLPLDLQGAVIYYVGPTPEKPGEVIGSAGPTSSYRMDGLSEPLMKLGLTASIGKGDRSPDYMKLCREYSNVYFTAIGGAGALISKCIISSDLVAFEDLGAEAIRKLEVVDFPLYVAIDANGNNIYKGAQR